MDDFWWPKMISNFQGKMKMLCGKFPYVENKPQKVLHNKFTISVNVTTNVRFRNNSQFSLKLALSTFKYSNTYLG